jgi:hypothetical protein
VGEAVQEQVRNEVVRILTEFLRRHAFRSVGKLAAVESFFSLRQKNVLNRRSRNAREDQQVW